jgi:hypothetical protein
MNEVQASKADTMFSLTEFKNSAVSFIKESFMQIERIFPFKGMTDKEPVDNYLKSPEEIEAEFSFVLNDRTDKLETYGRTFNNTDGYSNIMNFDQPSGFMEENY